MHASSSAGCTEDVLHSSIRIPPAAGETEPTYVCQNTQVKFATQPLKSWDLRQYVEDYTSGNVSLVRTGDRPSLHRRGGPSAEAGIGIGTPMRWIYDQVPARDRRVVLIRCGRSACPRTCRRRGRQLDLQAGERVRVKPYDEILKTLDSQLPQSRSLFRSPRWCRSPSANTRSSAAQKQIIDERTGKMLRFKTDAIVLKDVVCDARYAICRRFCPRAIYPYWREIWLERVPQDQVETNAATHR